MLVTLQALFSDTCDRLPDRPARVGVAVSGGSDSTALLVLACTHFGARNVQAVTVDHGLRDSATGEIEQVAALCTSLGCAHTVLKWTGWNGQGNLQAEARAARYRLIADWAQGAGTDTILLGHTLDDQAETFLMRLARGSGVDGLAAMADVRKQNGLLWARPLLRMSRADLRAMLTEKEIPWSDDPSNDDPAFDRIRLRRMMPELARVGLDAERLAQTAAHMARARTALDAATQSLAAQIVTQEAGDILFDRPAFMAAPEDLQSRLLAAALCWVSGTPYRPRFSALSTVLTGGSGTLHGARITATGTQLRITREWAALRDLSQAPTDLFDGRWKITGPATPVHSVRALGETGLRLCPKQPKTALPRASLRATPGIWDGDTLIAAPLVGHNPAWCAELSGKRADFLAYLRNT